MDKIFLVRQGCSEGFPEGKDQWKYEEQPCQPKENLFHPDSFTWIYIQSKIGHFGDISDLKKKMMFEEA